MSDEPKYLTTKKISNMLDINEKWLREHRGDIFKEGIHYHYPFGFKNCRWNVSAMLDWVENSASKSSSIADNVLKSLCA